MTTVSKLTSGSPFQFILMKENIRCSISATKTQAGLKIKAVLDESLYETGVKISQAQMKEVNIQPRKQDPEWNYSLFPHTG